MVSSITNKKTGYSKPDLVHRVEPDIVGLYYIATYQDSWTKCGKLLYKYGNAILYSVRIG